MLLYFIRCYLVLTGSEPRTNKRVNTGNLPAYLSSINKIICHDLQQTSLPFSHLSFLAVYSSKYLFFSQYTDKLHLVGKYHLSLPLSFFLAPISKSNKLLKSTIFLTFSCIFELVQVLFIVT